MDPPRIASKSALSGIYSILLAAFVVMALAVAEEVFIPLALATLVTFLVSPLVTRIERWVGRIAAVIVVVLMLTCVAGITGWILSRQLIDLGARLPDYKGNIQTKLRAVRGQPGGVFSRLSDMAEDLKRDLAPVEQPDLATATPVVAVDTPEAAAKRPLELARKVVSSLLGPLGTAGLSLLLVVFMLLQREDLRGRLIRLVGKGHISHTTRAMDDAGKRVSRFLGMQLIVNVTYGIAVGIGLQIIGIPNAILCGTLAIVLRFIPYVGPWIAAAVPILLSLAVFDNWTTPLLTIALFIVLELLSNNIMEPLLYGSSTGVSATALIVAAVFWTWLWGPIGLVLSAPLTVCLVVLGRHVPRLGYLSVLLSDEHPLTDDEECYYRLLAHNAIEVGELVDAYVKRHSIAALYDAILIPVITRGELDEQSDAIDEDGRLALLQSVRDLVEDTGSAISAIARPAGEAEATPFRLASVPARAERDELAAAMLAQLLTQKGVTVDIASAEMTVGELVEWTATAAPDAVCVSVVPPTTLVHARYLCAKLRARLPQTQIIAGLWGGIENPEDASRRLRASGANEVVLSLADALTTFTVMAGLVPEPRDVVTAAAEASGSLG